MNETELFLGIRPFWRSATLILDDVQALWGGRRIVVDGNGVVVVRTVVAGGGEATRQFSLGEREALALFQLCVDVDLVAVVMSERMGVPDEARPALTLVNGNGRQHTLTKWANDKQAGFDAVYEALLGLETGD